MDITAKTTAYLKPTGSASKLIYPAFFLSGFAGLGYQIVWTRAFSMGHGHEIPALLAIVAGFFLGLGCGALLLDRRISSSKRPGLWLVVLESIAALWAILTLVLIPMANEYFATVLGPAPPVWLHWLVSFTVPAVILFPATAAMGGTLPAADRLTARITNSSTPLPGLYAVNTAGAAVGVLLSIVLLLPTLGFNASIFILASADLLCAAIIFLGPAKGETSREEPEIVPSVKANSGRLSRKLLLMLLFFTGTLGIAYEVLVVRIMAQVLENTIYSYASALFIYLFGTSVGAWFFHKKLSHKAGEPFVLSMLLFLCACSCALGVIVLSQSSGLYNFYFSLFGSSITGAMLTEMALAAGAFLLPTFFMGMTFSCCALLLRGKSEGTGIALGTNTFGGFVASPLFGVLLISVAGVKISILTVIAGYLLLMLLSERTVFKKAALLSPGILLFSGAALANLKLVTPLGVGRITEHTEGVMASVAVVEGSDGAKHLKVNNRFVMGSTTGTVCARRMASIPLLLHPAPQRALCLGIGPALVFGAVSQFPGVTGDGVELVPGVVKFLPHFAPNNYNPTNNPALKVYTCDARRYVKATPETYDMILADLFHPGRDGAGALYTLEHYEAIKDKLRNAADGSPGIACQWLPLHLMDIGTMKIIMRTFLDVFPNAYLFLGNYDVHGMVLGLVGSEKPLRLNEDHFVNHFSDSNLTAFLKTIRYTEPLGFFHYFVAETDALRKYVGEGPLNTDNRPIVTWKAPAVSAYDDQKDGGPKMRLKSFLEAMRGLRGDTLDFIIDGSGNRSDGFSDRKILSIVKARDLFLLGRIEAEITSWNKCAQMFLEALSLYPEYDAVYDNLLEMCRRAYRRHPKSVHAWLTGLMQVSPQRPEAQELYARIFQPETMR